ncbi:MAG: ORF6N domain-containing protein [Bacteroidales bacterium]|nr:ORF6N domain-containing protein [Bacteroidales bacterium]
MEKEISIQERIYEVRGMRVMLDYDLALLYQVETRVLNQAVKRNISRFPEDFMFQIESEEWERMSSQFVTTSSRRPKTALPYAFTEHGVIMLAGLLRSEMAIQMSINITRAFIAMRNYIMSTRSIEAELSELRARLQLLERADEETSEAVSDLSEDVRAEISTIYQAIAALSVKVNPPQPPQQRKIGFKTGNDDEK